MQDFFDKIMIKYHRFLIKHYSDNEQLQKYLDKQIYPVYQKCTDAVSGVSKKLSKSSPSFDCFNEFVFYSNNINFNSRKIKGLEEELRLMIDTFKTHIKMLILFRLQKDKELSE